jgi:hypothetical protein
MANIHSVTHGIFRFMAGVILLSAACLSHAETVPATPGGSYAAVVVGYRNASSTGGGLFSTGAEACSAGGAYESFYAGSTNLGQYNSLMYKCCDASANRCFTGSYVMGCPNGGSISGTGLNATCLNVYTCPDASWTLSGQTCTRDDNACNAGASSLAGWYTGISAIGDADVASNEVGTLLPVPQILCDGQCVGDVVGVESCTHMSGATPQNPKPASCRMKITLTGQTCTNASGTDMNNNPPSVNPAPDSPAYNCAVQGKEYGVVNGSIVCVDPNVDTTTNSDGSKTKSEKPKADSTETTTTTNPDGSTTTTSSSSNKTTSCTNGVCTTTTTSTNSDGTSTTSTKQEPESEFCKSSPTSPLCKSSTFGNAECAAQPACEGDAVQCAQAVFSWEIKCALTEEPTDDAYKLGKTVASGGADPADNPFDPANIQEIDVESVVSQAAGQRSLTGTCIQSPSFSVLGHSYTMDTTKLCQFAEIVGNLMVALSTIIAIRMITS